ncbi:MAG TPA: HEAT repeat domain-containing protein [Myxococcales bacterium]|jgi:hypothetical protein
MVLEALAILFSLAIGGLLLVGFFLSPVAAVFALRGVYRALVRLARYPSRRVWEDAVLSLGFLDAGDRVMAGRLRGQEVRIEELWLGFFKRGNRLSVDCDGVIPPDFELARRSLLTGPSWGVDLGDIELHRAAYVGGPESVVLAALSWSARQAVLEACRAGTLKVHLSTVSLECPGSAHCLPDMAEWLVRAVEGLSAAKTPARALAASVESDPLDAVRLRCLEALVREYPDRPDCARACEAAFGDRSPLIRMKAAAIVGGDRGFAALAKLVDDPGLPAPLRAMAMDALPRASTPVSREELVARHLRSDEGPLRVAAARAVGRLKLAGLLEPLRRLATVEDPACQEATAKAMGALGDPGAEPALLGLLSHSRREIRIAAAVALGLVGTRAAIAPLGDAAAGGHGARPLSTLVRDGDALEAAARKAMRRIQGRLGGASAGQLSVVPDAQVAGGLSLSVAVGGELSMPGPQKA